MRQIQGFGIGQGAADEIRRCLYGLFQAFAADDGRRDDGRKDIPCPAALAADLFRFDLARPAVVVDEMADIRPVVDARQDDALRPFFGQSLGHGQ